MSRLSENDDPGFVPVVFPVFGVDEISDNDEKDVERRGGKPLLAEDIGPDEIPFEQMKRALFLAETIRPCLVMGCPAALVAQTTVRPQARAQTAPVPHSGDAADDPAVWIHPLQPDLSLILGTDKQGGLHSYNMDGSEHELVSDGTKPNNLDVLYGFKLDGRTADLAVASVRGGKNGTGLKLWAIDAASRRLSDVTDKGSIHVLGGKDAMGVCGYRSARTGRSYVFVTGEKGHVEQYELKEVGGGKVGATMVRTIKLDSLAEGCVADDELGFLYLAEETK